MKTPAPNFEKFRNLHNVPARQWKRWGFAGHTVFNELYGSMMTNPGLFQPPRKKREATIEGWDVIAWNAAWTAADAAKRVAESLAHVYAQYPPKRRAK